MAKLNLQLQLDREKDSEIFEIIQSYIFSYNLMSRISSHLKPIVTEVCDNSDGTIEFRVLDFDFDPKNLMEESDKAAEDFLSNMGISKEDILTNFKYTGEPKYDDDNK